MKEELIFRMDEKPHPECHASTLAETDEGIVVAWFGGTQEKHEDVGIWMSKNLKGRWSKPVEIVNGCQDNGLRFPCWNPVLFQPENGPLLLFYKVGPSPRNWWGMLTTSGNMGRYWSKPVKLGDDHKIGHLIGPAKNKPIQLEDGTIICPSSTETVVDNELLWRVHFEPTKDQGKTWEVVGPINDGKVLKTIQPSILTHPNGIMQILCRTRQGLISQSWSGDNGLSWSKMTSTEIKNPNSGTDAVTLKDGRHLLVYNPIGEGNGYSFRNILNLAVSDNGLDWNVALILEHETIVEKRGKLVLDDVGTIITNMEYSYPAIIQSKDGLVHITYTYRRNSIKYIVVDPSKI